MQVLTAGLATEHWKRSSPETRTSLLIATGIIEPHQGVQRMGMNAQAAQTMRNDMEAHRRVHRLFIERTGLHFETFDNLFGKSD
jgi:hypothetical protein